MIEAYTAHAPNGRKLAIMLEEIGPAYRAHRLDIAAGEPHAAWFLRLNPTLKRWGIALGDFAHLDRWYAHLTGRPAVRRGFEVPTSSRPRETPISGAHA